MNFQEITKSHPLVLVDFYADWCGPCKMMVPVFNERNRQLAAQMGIQSIPTMVLYKDGRQVWRQPGAMPLHALKQQVERFL